jgi:hypothetical protein
LVHRELRFPIEQVAQRFAFDVRHRVVEDFSCYPGIEEAEDVGVLQPGGEFDFLEKAVGPQRTGDLGPEDLECDPPLVLEVAGEIDGGHAAPPELALDRVAVREAGLQKSGRVGHLQYRLPSLPLGFQIRHEGKKTRVSPQVVQVGVAGKERIAG